MAAGGSAVEFVQEPAFPLSQDPGPPTALGGNLPNLAARQARGQRTEPTMFQFVAHQAGSFRGRKTIHPKLRVKGDLLGIDLSRVLDEGIDVSETKFRTSRGSVFSSPIVGENDASPKRSLGRQGHPVQSCRAVINGFSQFLIEIDPWDIPYIVISGDEEFAHPRDLFLQPEKSGRSPGRGMGEIDIKLGNAQLNKEFDRLGEISDRL